MSKYLITLSRFISGTEKKQIINDLNKQNIKAENDPFANKRIITNKFINNKPYIARTIKIEKTIYPKTIKEIIDNLKDYKIKEINGKIFKKTPFHIKAIKDRYLKKNDFRSDGKEIYIEARNHNNNIELRIGEVINSKKEQKINYPDIAIETPYTIGEISDFVRLAKSFNVKLYIITFDDHKSNKAIKDFLKENSFTKTKIKISKDYSFINNKYVMFGFSLWGKDNLSSLKEFKSKKTLLLFGNEKRGLKKESMDLCKKIIKITDSSEPLRATQANSFAFGYFYSLF